MERANIAKLARKWGITRRLVYEALKEGRIPGAELIDGKWYVPEDAEKPADRKSERRAGYISATKMVEKWGISQTSMSRLCQEGRIPGALQIGRYWHIPEDAKKPTGGKRDRKTGHISATKTAEKWGVHRTTVCRMCQDGRIPGAELIDGRWHIPEDAVNPSQQ